ncbi:MAG: metal-dependent phosphohydrolase [Actinomycetes bacterium]
MVDELRQALLSRGADLLARVGAGQHQPSGPVVEKLLDAYAEPHRGYHDLRHLAEVLDHVDLLAAEAAHPDLVRLAAWFHDAVYTASTTAGADEEASAQLAETGLTGLGVAAEDVREVTRLVRLTATHDPAAGDGDGAVLCDADLAVLARDEAGYAHYVDGVRREYAHVPDAAFRAGRAAVLRSLVSQPRLFRTPTGFARCESAARRNVTDELARIADP